MGSLGHITKLLELCPRWRDWVSVEVATLVYKLAWLSSEEERKDILPDLKNLGTELQKRDGVDPIFAYSLMLGVVMLGSEPKGVAQFEPVLAIMENLLKMTDPESRAVIVLFWCLLARKFLDTRYLEVGRRIVRTVPG